MILPLELTGVLRLFFGLASTNNVLASLRKSYMYTGSITSSVEKQHLEMDLCLILYVLSTNGFMLYIQTSSIFLNCANKLDFARFPRKGV